MSSKSRKGKKGGVRGDQLTQLKALAKKGRKERKKIEGTAEATLSRLVFRLTDPMEDFGQPLPTVSSKTMLHLALLHLESERGKGADIEPTELIETLVELVQDRALAIGLGKRMEDGVNVTVNFERYFEIFGQHGPLGVRLAMLSGWEELERTFFKPETN